MTIEITLAPNELETASVLGKKLASMFDLEAGDYGSNRPEQHMIGKRGELAAEQWVRTFPVFFIPFFRNLNAHRSEPDLGILSTGGETLQLR